MEKGPLKAVQTELAPFENLKDGAASTCYLNVLSGPEILMEVARA